MNIVTKRKGDVVSLPAKELDPRKIRKLSSPLAIKILRLLGEAPIYPMEIAKKLKVHEQKVYYHIRNLEDAGAIQVVKRDTIKGAQANSYGLIEPAFVVKFKDFLPTASVREIESQPNHYLLPFIENGQLRSMIIVGNPDPHGPEKARSRDGYYGIDFALLIGTFLNSITGLHVKLDTEVREEDLQNNLILIGGPVVNTITGRVNGTLPIRFNKKNNWNIFSTLSGRTYHNDETGIIVRAKNPFNDKKQILVLAGKRHSGTRAVIIMFLKHFKEIFSGNKSNPDVLAKVVEGIDLDSDGIVDEIEIHE